MYADVQLEVVLRLEGLPAGGAPEGPPEAVGGQVAAEVTLAGEHLETQGEGVRTHARTHTHVHARPHTRTHTLGHWGQGKLCVAVIRCCSRPAWVEYLVWHFIHLTTRGRQSEGL